MKKYLSLIIILLAVCLNLWLYFPETKILADPNDNIFQYSLVYRTNWVWQNYGCPLNPACIFNLVDHNVTYWAEGYALPFYYSHLPQIAIVSTYNLLIKPITALFGSVMALYTYYNWTKYLLLALFPIPVFLALRIIGFSPLLAALAALFASHYSTDGLYGIDPPSFLWRGYGLTSQLYAMFFMPLALAFTYRALKTSAKLFSRSLILAVFFLILTTAGHLGIGIISLLASFPLIFFDLNRKNFILRTKKLFTIYILVIFSLAYWIIPILFNNNYHIVSFWDPIWKFNSYGWFEVIRQFLNGEIFDWQRAPVLTGMIILGFFVTILDSQFFVFALIFALMMLLYFGRTTFGGLIDLIPGMKDFHQHRFIVGVQLTSLFLLPLAFKTLNDVAEKAGRIQKKYLKNINLKYLPLTVFLITVSILFYLTFRQTFKYNSLNSRWINEANQAYRYDEKHFLDLLDYLKDKPSGRIYAGRPGNWGKDFRLGSTQIYMLLSVFGYDVTQFLPETWSMMSENDQNFDERSAADYGLLNARYIVAPNPPAGLSADKADEAGNQGFPDKAKMIKKFGPFDLYEVPTSGWFDVVESPMFIKSDKTNFLNLVYLWHRGYPRTWKMHPLISVDKNPVIPSGMKRIIQMTDEVSYTEYDKDTPGVTGTDSPGVEETRIPKNIFADFPFAYPQSTPSGMIKNEKVSRQTYSATVDVPQSCINCFIMFKMSYHPNWQVKVDGQAVDKFAVFPFYVAAQTNPGIHTIEVTHIPDKLKTVLLFIEFLTLPLFIIYLKKKPR